MDNEIIKKISIRGRFAFGLTCLEIIVDNYQLRDNVLGSIIDEFWRFTNSEKLGQYEDYFISRNPHSVLTDFPLLKIHPERIHDFGFDNISFSELEMIYELYLKLPSSITSILECLITIANSNLSAGCGEFSVLTYEPTLKITEIIKKYTALEFYKPEDFLFSIFEQNQGWGNQFTKNNIVTRKTAL